MKGERGKGDPESEGGGGWASGRGRERGTRRCTGGGGSLGIEGQGGNGDEGRNATYDKGVGFYLDVVVLGHTG